MEISRSCACQSEFLNPAVDAFNPLETVLFHIILIKSTQATENKSKIYFIGSQKWENVCLI